MPLKKSIMGFPVLSLGAAVVALSFGVVILDALSLLGALLREVLT
jgi:hypothetical protein